MLLFRFLDGNAAANEKCRGKALALARTHVSATKKVTQKRQTCVCFLDGCLKIRITGARMANKEETVADKQQTMLRPTGCDGACDNGGRIDSTRGQH